MNEVVSGGEVQAEAPVDVPVTDQGPPTPPEPEAAKDTSPGAERRSAVAKALDAVGVTERNRTPDGKFAPVEKPAIDDKPVTLAEPKPAEVKAAPEVATPPARFSADAKAAWATAPDAIKGEVHRAIRELESGIQQKDAIIEPLKPFFEMAKQHGTTVDTALGNYVRLEQLLVKDPRAGLEALAQNLGTTLPNLIALAGGGKPGAPQQPQAQQTQEAIQLRQHIAGLEQRLAQFEGTLQEQQTAAVMQEVTSFAASHPRFEELAPEIKKLIETGYADTLQDAYEKAERLNPVPPSAPAVSALPAQPRPARSVTGAPTPGSNPAAGRPSESRREAVSSALARVGLG